MRSVIIPVHDSETGKAPQLEVARGIDVAIHCAGVKLPADHPENRAVYYEQASNAKAKISRLVTCLNDLTSICDMVILTFSRIACVSKLTAFVGFKIGFQFFKRI